MHDCQIIPFVSERSIIVINAMYKCLEGHFMQLQSQQRGEKASNQDLAHGCQGKFICLLTYVGRKKIYFLLTFFGISAQKKGQKASNNGLT